MPRIPKSAAFRELTGTKSEAAALPEYEQIPAGRPTCPKGLSPEARKLFRDLCKVLEQRTHLTLGDGHLIRLCCLVFERHQKALAHVAEQGEITTYTRLSSSGQPIEVVRRNLWMDVLERSEKTLFAMLRELGLSPQARKAVRKTAAPPAKPVNYLEQLNREYAEILAEEAAAGVAPEGTATPQQDEPADIDELLDTEVR